MMNEGVNSIRVSFWDQNVGGSTPARRQTCNTPTPGLDHGTQLQILVPQLAGSPHAAGHCKVSLGIVASCPAAFELLTDGMFFGAKTNTRRACRHHPTFQSDQSWNASVQLHIYMRTREWETEN
jgi:hypothetical protein